MNDVVSGEELDALVEAFRYVGLTEEADVLEETGSLEAAEWGPMDTGTT